MQPIFEKLDYFFSIAMDLFSVADFAGYFQLINKQWERVTGWSEIELKNKPFFEFIHPDEILIIKNEISKLVSNRSELYIENRFLCKNGNYIWLSWRIICDIEGNHLYAVARDITIQKRAEIELKKSESTLSSIFRVAPYGIGLLVNKAFIKVNDMLCKMTGYSEEEIIGHSTRIFYLNDEDYNFVKTERYRQFSLYGIGVSETKWKRKDGKIINVLLSSTPLDQINEGTGITLTAMDITQRIKDESDRIDLERKMLSSQKLESLGLLSGGIAHDFNNFMMGILGNLDLALMNEESGEPTKEYIENAKQIALKTAELTKQLLTYSGKGKISLKSISLSQVIKDSIPLFAASISKKITLESNLELDLPKIYGDITQLQQIIMNLVINSAEAIGDKNGTIKISTGLKNCNDEFLEQTKHTNKLEAGNYVYVEISDNGGGMDNNVQNHLFEPFFTTKFAGRGLGLSVILGIVKAHHGAITVDSELGIGTNIRVYLPVKCELDSSTADKSLSSSSSIEKTEIKLNQIIKCILIIDDEQAVIDVLKNFLQILKIKYFIAMDGFEGIEIFREHTNEIDLIILDLTMPKMDGGTAFSQLRIINPSIKIIMTSGYDEKEVSRKFTGKNVSGFLQKPYQYQDFQKELERVIKTNN